MTLVTIVATAQLSEPKASLTLGYRKVVQVGQNSYPEGPKE